MPKKSSYPKLRKGFVILNKRGVILSYEDDREFALAAVHSLPDVTVHHVKVRIGRRIANQGRG